MTSSVLPFVHLTHSLGDLDSLLALVVESVDKEVLRLGMSGVRSDSLQFSPKVFDPRAVVKVSRLFDECVTLAERSCGECAALPVSGSVRGRVLALVKEVQVSVMDSTDAPGLARKYFIVGTLSGVLSTVAELRRAVQSARSLVESSRGTA